MKNNWKQKLIMAAVGFLLVKIAYPDTALSTTLQQELLPLETFIIEPIELEQVSIWVPADKSEPAINRSCRVRGNCQYTCNLPAQINHTKSNDCSGPIGRILAEFTWPYHKGSLPLTIFNGWQWEYYYSFSQFENVRYDLPPRGGSWENCLEAVLSQSNGNVGGTWLRAGSNGKILDTAQVARPESNIEITSFSSIRTRHGYPKERILQ